MLSKEQLQNLESKPDLKPMERLLIREIRTLHAFVHFLYDHIGKSCPSQEMFMATKKKLFRDFLKRISNN